MYVIVGIMVNHANFLVLLEDMASDVLVPKQNATKSMAARVYKIKFKYFNTND